MSDVNLRLETLFRLARSTEDRIVGRSLSYSDFDFDDGDVRARLRKIAISRELTLDDLDRVLLEVEQIRAAEMMKVVEFVKACEAPRDDLKIFYVYNTADKKLVVLAKDAACARYFASAAGHIRERKNGRVMVLKAEQEFELRRSGDALGRALRDGRPGVVMQVGDNVVMRNAGTVFTPFTVIDGAGGKGAE